MKISVLGLGYVGAVSSACLARKGHTVVGCDIDPKKLELIRSGQSPIVEVGMPELMHQVVSDGRLTVTDDVALAVATTELTFICVGTPSRKTGGQDLRAVERVSEQVGLALRDLNRFHVCVLRSTVPPGTTDDVVLPILEARSGKQAGQDFGLCFQPEFLREGSSIRDFERPPFTVIGTCGDKRTERILEELYRSLPSEFFVASTREAEMVKLASNAFHALKVVFANEIGRIARSTDVNGLRVMSLLCRDTELNISPAYLRPGFAFGGSCLPKDVRALVHLARDRAVETPMLSGLLPSNRLHVEHALDLVLGLGKRSVALVGLTFKGGTDDLRESPLVHLAELLLGKGIQLRIHDPLVHLSRLIGANRAFIEETIPHISSLLVQEIGDALKDSEVVVIGHAAAETVASLRAHGRSDQVFVDLVGLSEPETLPGRYLGLCW